jgi:hypothetical protein
MVCGSAQAEEPREYFSQSSVVKGEGTQFAQKSEAVKSQPEDNTPFQVRCWQNGVLIVDESNWRSPQMQSRFVAMKPMIGNEPGLYFVDFYNTFCEFKKR